MLKNQNLYITKKKEFIDIFKVSKAASFKKEKSHFLARQPKKSIWLTKLEKMEDESKYDTKLFDTLKLKIKKLKRKLNTMNLKNKKMKIAVKRWVNFTSLASLMKKEISLIMRWSLAKFFIAFTQIKSYYHWYLKKSYLNL